MCLKSAYRNSISRNYVSGLLSVHVLLGCTHSNNLDIPDKLVVFPSPYFLPIQPGHMWLWNESSGSYVYSPGRNRGPQDGEHVWVQSQSIFSHSPPPPFWWICLWNCPRGNVTFQWGRILIPAFRIAGIIAWFLRPPVQTEEASKMSWHHLLRSRDT